MLVEKITLGEKQVVLVGTAHVSKDSVELVRKTIEEEKPDIVGVELDFQRLQQLRQGKKWQETDLNQVIKEGKTHLFLLNLLLSNLQRQIGEDLGIKPGSEMLEAIEAAAEQGITVALLDRDVRVTLKRALNKMSLLEKIRLGYGIISALMGIGQKLDAETIEKLKEKDVLNALMQQLAKELPSVKEVLVDERDVFIANRIMQSNAKKIVAVVGAGHLEGIKENLGKQVNIAQLARVEKKKSWLPVIGYAVPILFFALIAYGFFIKGPTAALDVFLLWFLITGTLAALGALVAFAHPFSILTAFFAAPFTTLHPALAAGWFAGAVELKMRPPKVQDFEKLPELSGLRAISSNRVTRILIVTAFANIGATIGTVIALPYLAAMLL